MQRHERHVRDNNNGQSNLAVGGIVTNWGSDPQISPFPYNTVLLGTTRVSLLNGISFRPAALAGCTSVTDVQTDHATAAISDAA